MPICGACGKEFITNLDFLMHMLEHTGNYCPILECGHRFRDLKRMPYHLRKHAIIGEKMKIETDDEGEDEEERRREEEEEEKEREQAKKKRVAKRKTVILVYT
ncbi:hypothetical protein PMAYCL1PPCAC_00954, partial [Pristionchus mayeri]